LPVGFTHHITFSFRPVISENLDIINIIELEIRKETFSIEIKINIVFSVCNSGFHITSVGRRLGAEILAVMDLICGIGAASELSGSSLLQKKESRSVVKEGLQIHGGKSVDNYRKLF
jgi:hypothetical protein